VLVSTPSRLWVDSFESVFLLDFGFGIFLIFLFFTCLLKWKGRREHSLVFTVSTPKVDSLSRLLESTVFVVSRLGVDPGSTLYSTLESTFSRL
jgi:hypothetical protein